MRPHALHPGAGKEGIKFCHLVTSRDFRAKIQIQIQNLYFISDSDRVASLRDEGDPDGDDLRGVRRHQDALQGQDGGEQEAEGEFMLLAPIEIPVGTHAT